MLTLRSMLDSAHRALSFSECTCAEVEVRLRDETGRSYTDAELDADVAGKVVLMSIAHDLGCPLVDA